MDRLRCMKTFVRVVEAGSFTAVAREEGKTQSAVSKQIASLEAQLGTRLLTRTTRALKLTEEGEAYFEKVQRILAELEEVESSLAEAPRRLSGWIRVAASVGFGRLVLLPIVQRFLEANPLVKVDLRLSDAFIDLTEQGIDIALRIGHLADTSFVARRIGSTRRLLVAHRDWVRRMKRQRGKGPGLPREPEDLLHHNCIVYTELATGNEWRFVASDGARVKAGSTRAVRVGGNLRSNSSEVARAAVMAGLGIGYSPDWLFANELQSGEILPLLPEWSAPEVPMHFVSAPNRRRPAKVEAFATLVAEELKRLHPWLPKS